MTKGRAYLISSRKFLNTDVGSVVGSEIVLITIGEEVREGLVLLFWTEEVTTVRVGGIGYGWPKHLNLTSNEE